MSARGMWGLIWIGLAACLPVQGPTCADGTVCPAGKACTVDSRCVDEVLVAACREAGDGGCEVSGAVGTCVAGACSIDACGNRLVDEGEACDDGNQADGDGCRADCGKLEVCGDGALDLGEACDDGNANPGDRCDACAPTSWLATAPFGAASALQQRPYLPHGLAVDGAGNVYVADTERNRVLRVTAAGDVEVFAGTGRGEIDGDGGSARSAGIAYPHAVAVDSLGQVLISDYVSARVRIVGTDGIIRAFAGTGNEDYAGDGQLALAASFTFPSAMVFDGLGRVFLTDEYVGRVRWIDEAGIVRTYAGGGAGGRGDGGAADQATLIMPSGLARNPAGDLFIADRGDGRVRRVTPAGKISTALGGGETPPSATGTPPLDVRLDAPVAVATAPDGTLFVADRTAGAVYRLDADGLVRHVVGLPGAPCDDGPAMDCGFVTLAGVGVDPAGRLWILDEGASVLYRMEGDQIAAVLGRGEGIVDDGRAALSVNIFPGGVAVRSSGGLLIADGASSRVIEIQEGLITTVAGTSEPGDAGDGGAATAAQFLSPHALAITGAGDVLIADAGARRIRRLDAAGTVHAFAGTGAIGDAGDLGPAALAQFRSLQSLAVSPTGEVYVADPQAHRVRRIAPDGTIYPFAGDGRDASDGDGGPAASAALRAPYAVAVGLAGEVYIVDEVDPRVRVVTNGVIAAFAGTGAIGQTGEGGPPLAATLSAPRGVGVDSLGRVWISDNPPGRGRVLRVSADRQVIELVAGAGNGWMGDGGPALQARIGMAQALAIGPDDAVYVGDSTLRQIDADGVITTRLGDLDPLGLGRFAGAALADPRALATLPGGLFVAGGQSGLVQRVRDATATVDAVAGRYRFNDPVGAVARYRGNEFGSVGGVAYDPATATLYLTETSAHRVLAVDVVDPAQPLTWTIRDVVGAEAGALDGPRSMARLRQPTGLWLDATARRLWIADTGNHAIRVFDLEAELLETVAGTLAIRGFAGDGGAALGARLFGPTAIAACADGTVYVADTDNHRVRRLATDGTIATVLGVGVPSSAGEGAPSRERPVWQPRGVACDGHGNVLVTSTNAVRRLAAPADGAGAVDTLFAAGALAALPASATACLTGLVLAADDHARVVDACSGALIDLVRTTAPGP